MHPSRDVQSNVEPGFKINFTGIDLHANILSAHKLVAVVFPGHILNELRNAKSLFNLIREGLKADKNLEGYLLFDSEYFTNRGPEVPDLVKFATNYARLIRLAQFASENPDLAKEDAHILTSWVKQHSGHLVTYAVYNYKSAQPSELMNTDQWNSFVSRQSSNNVAAVVEASQLVKELDPNKVKPPAALSERQVELSGSILPAPFPASYDTNFDPSRQSEVELNNAKAEEAQRQIRHSPEVSTSEKIFCAVGVCSVVGAAGGLMTGQIELATYSLAACFGIAILGGFFFSTQNK